MIELLSEPLRQSTMFQNHLDKEQNGVCVVKYAVGALVLDASGDVLMCTHRERGGEFSNGAIGFVTETLKYQKNTDGITLGITESPIHALKRCFREELDLDVTSLETEQLHFDRQNPAFFSEWEFINDDGVHISYPIVNMVMRTEDPELFMLPSEGTLELDSTMFAPPNPAMLEHMNTRPGAISWLRRMLRFESQPVEKNVIIEVDWGSKQLVSDIDARMV